MSPMFDTNVFISGDYSRQIRLVKEYVLCAVVVQELLVGGGRQRQNAILKLAQDFDRSGRLIVPDRDDWYEVGKCLQKLLASGTPSGQRFTKEYVNCLVRDALIARCAIRARAEVITANTIDFNRVKSVLRTLKHRTPSEFFGVRPR